MLKVGFIGIRGMVGTVLFKRMLEENDFADITPIFFSTSLAGARVPDISKDSAYPHFLDSFAIDDLLELDCIVSTQGSDYTKEVLPQLLARGYDGYWLDSSSYLRMREDTMLVLDPINNQAILEGLDNGVKLFSGANCTVSLMLMAINGLLQEDLVEWVDSMSYQAASGAGSMHMRELLIQSYAACCVATTVAGSTIADISGATSVTNALTAKLLADVTKSDILEIDANLHATLRSIDLPTENFSVPLAFNVLPWIDEKVGDNTKEEWKGMVEANKIMGLAPGTLKVDGLCVRTATMRSHAQALTIKLKTKNISIAEIERLLIKHNPWVKVIKNTKEDTLNSLTPVAVSGSLDIAIGRLRKLNFGEDYLAAFTVGDQLLWGAAEPMRRMLKIIVNRHQGTTKRGRTTRRK